MLEVRGLRAAYGAAEVLHSLDLRVAGGTIVTLVGANGAGKSTLLRCLSGLLRPTAGDARFEGRHLGRLRPPAIVRLGMVHVPENRQIFATLSVADNLRLGAYTQLRRLTPAELGGRIDEVMKLFPVLAPRLGEEAGSLSGGQQQMLAIARGLMSRPRVLLLDEPSLGLAPLVVGEIFAVLRRLRSDGVGILLVEQSARQALAISDYAYVLETGRIALEGSGRDLLDDPGVVDRYLGVGPARFGAEASAEARAIGGRLRRVLAGTDVPGAT